MTNQTDISTDTGKLTDALRGGFPTTCEARNAADYTAEALRPMNAALSGRFRRAAQQLTEQADIVAYLVPVNGDPALALHRAVQSFQRREDRDPEWAAVGESVTLPTDTLERLGLSHRTGIDVQPGCIMVGISENDDGRPA